MHSFDVDLVIRCFDFSAAAQIPGTQVQITCAKEFLSSNASLG